MQAAVSKEQVRTSSILMMPHRKKLVSRVTDNFNLMLWSFGIYFPGILRPVGLSCFVPMGRCSVLLVLIDVGRQAMRMTSVFRSGDRQCNSDVIDSL